MRSDRGILSGSTIGDVYIPNISQLDGWKNPSVKTAPPLTPFTWRVDLWPRRRLTKHGACTCSLWVYFEGIVIRTIQNSYLYNVHTYIHTRIHPYIHTYMHICLYHIRIIYIYIYHTCIYMHQALPPPLPPPHGMGPIYCPHVRSSPSPPCGVVGVWYCPPPPLWCGGGVVWYVGYVWCVWSV